MIEPIYALYEEYAITNTDSKVLRKLWKRLRMAVKTKKTDDIYSLALQYAEETERRGYKAGFRDALRLIASLK